MRHRRRLREIGEDDSDDELMATIRNAVAVEEGQKGTRQTDKSLDKETRKKLQGIKPQSSEALVASDPEPCLGKPEGSTIVSVSQQSSPLGGPTDIGNLNTLIEALKREESGFGRP